MSERLVALRLDRGGTRIILFYVYGFVMLAFVLWLGLVLWGAVPSNLEPSRNPRTAFVLVSSSGMLVMSTIYLLRDLAILPAALIVRLADSDLVLAPVVHRPVTIVRRATSARVDSHLKPENTWSLQRGSHRVTRYRWTLAIGPAEVWWTSARSMTGGELVRWTRQMQRVGYDRVARRTG